MLEYVDLSENWMSQWSVYCALIRHSCVNSLTVCGDEGIGDYVEEITNSLNANIKLQSLTLCHIGKSALKPIKEVLVNNTTLNEMNLSWEKVRRRNETNVLLHTTCSLSQLGNGTALNSNNREVNINILFNSQHGCFNDTIDLHKIVNDHKCNNDAMALIALGLYNNTSVQAVNASSCEISDGGAVAIGDCCKYNSLKELDLSSNKITECGMDYLLKSIRNVSTVLLEYVDFSSNGSSPWDVYCVIIRCCCNNSLIVCGDAGMKEHVNEIAQCLEANKKLESLTLCSIGKTGVETIKIILFTNTTLHEVNLSWKKIGSKGVKDINNILLSTKFQVSMLNKTVSWNSTDRLVVINVLYDEYHSSLSKTIDLSKMNIDSDTIAVVAFGLYHNTTVLELDISSQYFPENEMDVVFECLKTCTIEKLTVLQTQTSRSLLQYQRIMKSQLKKKVVLHIRKKDILCNMYNKKIDDSALKIVLAMLHSHTKIREIDISHNTITDEGATAISNYLKNNSTIKYLNVSWNFITVVGARRMLNATKGSSVLQRFDISYCNILDDEVVAISTLFKHNKTIQEFILSWKNKIIDTGVLYLDLSDQKINDCGALLVSNLLHNNIKIKALDLSKNYVSHEGTVAISHCLKNNNALQELDLSRNNINCKEFASCVQENTALQKLNLSYNNIPDEGIQCISDSLKNNMVLQELNLSGNCIKHRGAEALGIFIKVNTTVQKLDISYCGIPDNGAEVISEACKVNKTIQELTISWKNDEVVFNSAVEYCNLSGKKIGNIGARIVSNILYNNVKIKKLNLSDNGISEEGKISIDDCIQSNKVLEEIDMRCNNITDLHTTLKKFRISGNSMVLRM